jgi:arsenite-transporting ATPase
MALTGLRNKNIKLILFGGKGGVGKTTCAVSTSIFLSRNYKTLLISTDPAHSLSDNLGVEIGDGITEVKGIKNLSAIEVNAEKVFSEFKIHHEKEIKKILDNSTYLDKEDIDSIFSLPIPGIDEVMGFKIIVDLMEESGFEKYIVDTAPTGHALRLLTFPDLLNDWIKVMAKMRWKYRYMVESFSGKYNPDEGDDFLLTMKKTVNKIKALLLDELRTEFIVVTIPEYMGVLETERMLNSLRNYGITVRQIVINNVLDSKGCSFCVERRKEQEKYIEWITKKNNVKTTITFLQPQEVRGIRRLSNFMEALCQN